MNLQNLPAGQHLYTAFVGDMSSHDEVDFQAEQYLPVPELIVAAKAALTAGGYDPAELLGLADQCTSEGILWRAPGINGEDLSQ